MGAVCVEARGGVNAAAETSAATCSSICEVGGMARLVQVVSLVVARKDEIGFLVEGGVFTVEPMWNVDCADL